MQTCCLQQATDKNPLWKLKTTPIKILPHTQNNSTNIRIFIITIIPTPTTLTQVALIILSYPTPSSSLIVYSTSSSLSSFHKLRAGDNSLHSPPPSLSPRATMRLDVYHPSQSRSAARFGSRARDRCVGAGVRLLARARVPANPPLGPPFKTIIYLKNAPRSEREREGEQRERERVYRGYTLPRRSLTRAGPGNICRNCIYIYAGRSVAAAIPDFVYICRVERTRGV